MFLSRLLIWFNIVGVLCDREVAYSALDRQGSNLEFCVWRAVLSHSSHHLQEVLLARLSLYVHKGGLKPSAGRLKNSGVWKITLLEWARSVIKECDLHSIKCCLCICTLYEACWGGGPRVVVSTVAFHARVRGSVPGLGDFKETKMFLPHPRVKVSIVGSLRDREVACSASDRQGSNFESCVWRTVSSQSSHHPQEVLLAQFSLYVHKGGLRPDSFHYEACCISYTSTLY